MSIFFSVKTNLRAGVETQWFKPLPAMPASLIVALAHVLFAVLLIQIPTKASGKTEDPSTGASAAHVKELDGIPFS